MHTESNKTWCATKVDENGRANSSDDYFGFCDETCPLDLNGTSKSKNI
jgi:hypothetical protein